MLGQLSIYLECPHKDRETVRTSQWNGPAEVLLFQFVIISSGSPKQKPTFLGEKKNNTTMPGMRMPRITFIISKSRDFACLCVPKTPGGTISGRRRLLFRAFPRAGRMRGLARTFACFDHPIECQTPQDCGKIRNLYDCRALSAR